MSKILNERLKQYLEAEKTVLIAGQSYTINNRTLTRANLKEIQDMIAKLISAGATVDEVEITARPGSRSKQVLFRD